MNHTSRRAAATRSAACLPLFLCLFACSAAQEPLSPEQGRRLARLHDAGPGVPLVLHPVRVLGRPDPRCAQSLGLVLEKNGMSALGVADAAFAVDGDTDWGLVPERFGDFVREHAPTAATGALHLYGEFLGTPQQGPTEVRFLVVDERGELVLTDRQTPSDRAFRRTAARDPDPLGCAMLVADRLFTLAAWDRRPDAVQDGTFATLWRQMSGAPDAREQAAMAARLTTLRERLGTARCVVLPTIVHGRHVAAEESGASAERLAAGLTRRFGCSARAVVAAAPIAITADSNEQKRLWDLARGLGRSAKAHAAAADYAVAVDVGFDDAGSAGYVHLAIVTATGEPVLVDWQNDQHAMLQRAAPASLADTERFVVERLAGRLTED